MRKRIFSILIAAIMAFSLLPVTGLAAQDGWVENDGAWYYYVDGAALTGWAGDIPGWEGQWFYFDNNGVMVTGNQDFFDLGTLHFENDGRLSSKYKLSGTLTIDDSTGTGADCVLSAIYSINNARWSYQWYTVTDDVMEAIPGATQSTYTITTEDAGKTLQCVVNGIDFCEGQVKSEIVAVAAHGHNTIPFIPWTDTTALPTAEGSYYLTEDVTLSSQWQVPAGTTNLCLNGHVIMQTMERERVIYVPTNATLNLFDCNTEAKHYFNVGEDGLWTLINSETANYVNGGIIIGGSAENGGGVYNSGTFNMSGGTIAGNTSAAANNCGGGVYAAADSAFTLSGGTITGNSANKNGGGVFLHEKGTFAMTGGTITGNSAGKSGGGVYTYNGTIELSGGAISGNSASDTAGGVYDNGEMIMTGGTVTGNSAGNDAGGVFVNATCTFDMQGGMISGNSAGRGGGVYVNTYGKFTMTAGKICDNAANGAAGIYNSSNAVMKLLAAKDEAIEITGNKAEKWEGGIANWGEMHLSGKVLIRNNTCDDADRPINLATKSPIVIDDALTGSDICVTHAISSSDVHDAGVLTTDYSTKSGGTGLNDFFHYDGPDSFAMILNDSNELEAANIYVITNSVKADDKSTNYGYLTIDKTSAVANETVTVTVEPLSGYRLKAGSLKATYNDGGDKTCELTAGGNNTYTFAMPAYAVTVMAEFEPVPVYYGDPTISVPVSGEENSVNVKATVSGKTATVQPIREAELKKVIGDGVEPGAVTVDLSGLKQDITAVRFPTKTMNAVAEAAADAENDTAGLKLIFSSGTLEFDAKALETITEAAGTAQNVEIHFDSVGTTRLNADQKAAVSEMVVVEGFEAYVSVNGKRVSDFNGGSVTVYIPYEIPEGNNPAGYTVWSVAKDGTMEKQIATYDGTNHRFIVIHFSDCVLTYDETYGAYNNCPKDNTCPASKFTDVDGTAWYHDGIHFCVENGIMNGITDTEFDVTGDVTRAQIVTMLWRLDGEKYANYAMTFEDVADAQWYTEAVRWAASEKIVNGYGDGKFGTNDSVTREQLATILYRYAQSKGQGFTGSWMFLLDFVDRADISSWADEAIHWCSMKGIVEGKGNDLFDPQGTAIRAEAAAMMQRFCEALEK